MKQYMTKIVINVPVQEEYQLGVVPGTTAAALLKRLYEQYVPGGIPEGYFIEEPEAQPETNQATTVGDLMAGLGSLSENDWMSLAAMLEDVVDACDELDARLAGGEKLLRLKVNGLSMRPEERLSEELLSRGRTLSVDEVLFEDD